MRRMLSTNLKHFNPRLAKRKHLNRLTSMYAAKKTNSNEKAEMASLLRMNTTVMQGLRNSFLPLTKMAKSLNLILRMKAILRIILSGIPRE